MVEPLPVNEFTNTSAPETADLAWYTTTFLPLAGAVAKVMVVPLAAKSALFW